MTKHRIIFAGTPEFAAVALRELLNSPHEIIAVYTQPDRPAGRGRQLTASPVKVLATENNLPVAQTISGLDVLRIWQAEILADVASKKPAGTILQTSIQGIDVATGEGVLRLQQVQMSGARVMSAAEFLNAPHENFRVGKVLG